MCGPAAAGDEVPEPGAETLQQIRITSRTPQRLLEGLGVDINGSDYAPIEVTLNEGGA